MLFKSPKDLFNDRLNLLSFFCLKLTYFYDNHLKTKRTFEDVFAMFYHCLKSLQWSRRKFCIFVLVALHLLYLQLKLSTWYLNYSFLCMHDCLSLSNYLSLFLSHSLSLPLSHFVSHAFLYTHTRTHTRAIYEFFTREFNHVILHFWGGGKIYLFCWCGTKKSNKVQLENK